MANFSSRRSLILMRVHEREITFKIKLTIATIQLVIIDLVITKKFDNNYTALAILYLIHKSLQVNLKMKSFNSTISRDCTQDEENDFALARGMFGF